MSKLPTTTDHTSVDFDPETLNPAQLDGRACVVCGTEHGPMKPVDLHVHEGGETQLFACSSDEQPEMEQLATAVERLQDGLKTATQQQIPATWQDAAREAGTRAAENVRITYQSTMAATKAQAASDEPAFWLASHPCPPWCAVTDLHRSGDHPDDRQHDGDVHAVSFDSMPPSVGYAVYAAPQMTMSLSQRFREVEARVSIEMEGEPVAHATLDEIEQAAFAMLALVRLARGQEPLKVLPFDEHGRCVTADCTVCRVEGASA